MAAGGGYQTRGGFIEQPRPLLEGRERRIDFAALREAGLQRQVRANERFDLVPNGGIALDLNVGLHDQAVPPGILTTTEGFSFVAGAEIAEDASARWISGANLGLAVEQAIELIKIDGLEDVGRNYGVIFTKLGDAIDLDGEDYGNAVFFKLAGQFDGF